MDCYSGCRKGEGSRPLNKKIIIKKKYTNHLGEDFEITEEITSDCQKFHDVFDNLNQLCKKQLSNIGFFDFIDFIEPSDN